MADENMAPEPVQGQEPEAMPASEPVEPLYRIVLNMVLAAIFIFAVSFVVLTAFTMLNNWLVPQNVHEVSTDLLYLVNGLWLLTKIIIYCAIFLTAIYLIAKLDWKTFVEKMGFRLDRYGLRLFMAGALLAVAACIATIGISLMTGCIRYDDHGIRMAFMVANGNIFVENASIGLIDELPPLSLIISSALFLSIALATAFGETVLTRGYLQRSLTAKHGGFIAIIVIAVLSGLLSMITGTSVLGTIDSFFFNILIGYLYLMTGSLLLPAGFHFAWTFLTMEYIPSGYYSTRLLYVYFDQPVKLAGVSIGTGYYAVSIAVTLLLLVLLLYYSHKRREKGLPGDNGDSAFKGLGNAIQHFFSRQVS